jgi:hypothetical protein
MAKQRRHRAKAWIEYTNKSAKDEMVGYYNVILKGKMEGPAGTVGQGIFGGFEKINDNWLWYTATVWSDQQGEIYHSFESEYLDDLHCLKHNQLDY